MQLPTARIRGVLSPVVGLAAPGEGPRSLMPNSNAGTQFSTVQALRAVAALLVVLLHALQMWGERVDNLAPGVAWENGAAGVDIFFVISGFVMVISSQGLMRRPSGWWVFLRHRLIRIVPLYWIMTSLKLLAVVLLGGLAIRTQLDIDYVTRSYLFLPVLDGTGKFRPLLPVGWTLTFELLFYLLFALALALRVGVLRVLGPALAIIAVVALFRSAAWPAWTILADTIVLEFLFGVLLGKAVVAGQRLGIASATLLFVGGFLAILMLPPASDVARVLVWGLPAAALVSGAVFMEPIAGGALPGWLLRLGDASYAIYLSHGLVLPAIGILIVEAGLSGLVGEFAAIFLCLLLSSAAGLLLHVYLERPMTAWLRKSHAPGDLNPVASAAATPITPRLAR